MLSLSEITLSSDLIFPVVLVISGSVSMNQFLEWHHLPRCWMSEKVNIEL